MPLYCTCTRNTLKIFVNGFIFSTVGDLQFTMDTSAEHLFWGMILNGFSVDTYKKEKKIDIYPIRSKFIKQAVTFSNIQTWLLP